MLVRLPNKETQTVIRALARRIRRLPQGLMKSLTWDRGSELAAHRAFTIATNIQVYFCDPQSPWQRGSNETPMAYCASTCHTRSTSPATAKRDWMLSQCV
jgi:IS30 family transposase